MSRAPRLLELLQVLRRHRRPVTGAALAAEVGVSLRTLYRDIAALQAQGADIRGEAGLGYVLKPGFTLPLMFTPEEIEALALGSQWVAARTDQRLAGAARNALAKIGAVTPPELADVLDSSTLIVAARADAAAEPHLPLIRDAIRQERKLSIAYVDAAGGRSERVIWPFALAFFDQTRMIAAWCESRVAFRHFRTDRIAALTPLETRYPRRRAALLKEWRAAANVPAPDRN